MAVKLDIKAVPGARRDEVAGWLGERLKVRVSAPPEDGRANAAICRLLAGELGLPEGAVMVIRGHGTPLKTLEVRGVEMAAVLARWPRAG